VRNENQPIELSGMAGAPGIAMGRAYHIDRPHLRVPHHQLPPPAVEFEIERLNSALNLSRNQLIEAKARLNMEEHLQIIEAHIALYEDPELIQRLRDRISQFGINAEWAVTQLIAELTSLFDQVEDIYLRERRRDFEYIERRLLMNLMGIKQESLENIEEPVILVAHDLSPADFAHINRERILGIVTDIGGTTSHMAIMARALEIPTVVGLEKITETVKTGDLIIIDGFTGTVIRNPAMDLINEYENRRRQHEQLTRDLRRFRDLPTATADAVRVRLAANIELPSELDAVKDNGLNHIGLFRTEFLFLFGAHSPTEEEQYAAYRNVIERLGPNGETTIRTIDLGGDKAGFAAESGVTEQNPAMGLRAIRLCFQYPEIFRDQLRAILRASAHGKIRIMFPMISGLAELRQAKEMLRKVQDELRAAGVPFDEHIPLGIMIETPASTLIADLLAAEVDFFSIGTNDLIQYTLAVDRGNEHVSYLFHPLHPAILRSLRLTIDAARAAGIPVAMCGEMAGQPEIVMFLLGMGITELSMTPNKALLIKRLIGRFRMADARRLVEEAMTMKTANEITEHVVGYMLRTFPEEFGIVPPSEKPN